MTRRSVRVSGSPRHRSSRRKEADARQSAIPAGWAPRSWMTLSRFGFSLMVLLLVQGMLVSAETALAASYGTELSVADARVIYRDVEDRNGHFGAPLVTRTSLLFREPDAELECRACAASPLALEDRLSTRIDSADGQGLEILSLTQWADWRLESFGQDGFSQVSITGSVLIKIFEVDGLASARARDGNAARTGAGAPGAPARSHASSADVGPPPAR